MATIVRDDYTGSEPPGGRLTTKFYGVDAKAHATALNDHDDRIEQLEGGTVEYDQAAATHEAPLRGTPANEDEIAILNAAAAFALNRVSIGTLFAQLPLRSGTFINVKDPAYGAVGNGIADDTTAIRNAIQACWNAGGGTVYFPPGTYMVSSPIFVRPRQTHSGTAQAGSNNTVTLANSATTNNFEYHYSWIRITSGTGSGQTRKITSYDGTTKVATVSSNWDTNPDATSQYTIQYFTSAIRTVSLKGASVYASRITAAVGFTDDTFDGQEYVIRCDSSGLNERYGYISDLRILGNSQADHCMSVAGIVEREFSRLTLEGATVSPLVVDGSQNSLFQSVHLQGGQYDLELLNGAGSNHFHRVEFAGATVDTIRFDVDNSLRMRGWIPGVHGPLANKFTKCLMEAPPSGQSQMVPLRLKYGTMNIFDSCTFATFYTSGTKSEAVVIVGDGAGGTYPCWSNHFKDCQFHRSNDPTSSNVYVKIQSGSANTVLSHCIWSGGHSGGDFAVQTDAPVHIFSPELIDHPKTFDNNSGSAVSNIQLVTAFRIAGTTAQRPSHGGEGVRPAYFNTDTSRLEFYDGSNWLNIVTDDVMDAAIAAAISGIGGDGDMLAAIYDPQEIAADVFDRSNHTGTQDVSTIDGLTTALATKADVITTVNSQVGTSYTLVLADATKLIECNNASPFTLTVPPNSSEAFPVGTVIPIDQLGAGQVTIAAGSGVTIHSKDGNLKLAGQYSGATLRKRATDTWILTGDLVA